MTDAVGARVAAADHDHVLPGGADRGLATELDRAGALIEVLHREVDAVELAARHGQVARNTRPGREHDGVVLFAKLIERRDIDAEAELDAFGDELLHAALDERLLDLELGNAEADEPARRLVALVDDDLLAGARELLRAREPGRAGPNHSDDRPGGHVGGCGTIQPSSQARLTIESSTCLIDTAFPSSISSTHAASHGAGQSRPVNSGKLFVRCNCAIASCQRSR